MAATNVLRSVSKPLSFKQKDVSTLTNLTLELGCCQEDAANGNLRDYMADDMKVLAALEGGLLGTKHQFQVDATPAIGTQVPTSTIKGISFGTIADVVSTFMLLKSSTKT